MTITATRTEETKIAAIMDAINGMKVANILTKYKIVSTTFYTWRKDHMTEALKRVAAMKAPVKTQQDSDVQDARLAQKQAEETAKRLSLLNTQLLNMIKCRGLSTQLAEAGARVETMISELTTEIVILRAIRPERMLDSDKKTYTQYQADLDKLMSTLVDIKTHIIDCLK